ncbi:Uncharacterised protein [Enterobacter cloacae]|nr:Uncharacterised protein [Enterobacter cloacae]
MRRVNDVALNHHVLVDEIRRVGVVSDNAAHLRRRQIHLVDTFAGEEVLHRKAIKQVQLVAGANNHLNVAALFQLANNRGTHHSAMTGDKNTLFCHSQDSSAMATS